MNKIKKVKNYLLSFIIPFILCLAIFYFKDILLNVENIYVSDLRLQHFVFLTNLKNILLGDASLFYSFSAGMGSPMISTIIFYCLSPVNLLLLALKDVRYAILFIYIIKVSLSGLTMFMLLKNKRNQDNFITVLFSTCYALSAFVINYFFSVFWFDSLYLAPLVMLGIDKIFKNEKINLLYIFSLALAIICNIQMGFGLCIYALIYYIYSYNINYDIKKDLTKFKQLGIIFVISSLCAGAISSGALLGFGLDYQNIFAARAVKVTTSAGVSNLGYIIKNIFTVGNFKQDYYNNFEPFIYCGLIVSFFSILYLFNRDIDKKKRLHAFFVILVFIISFCIGFINLFWHLTSPVLLNYRYSIYLGLFLTMLAYECYCEKIKLIKGDIIVLSILLLVGFFVIVAYANEVYVLWSFVFLILIFTFILLSKNKSKKFEILLSILIIAEIFMNGYLSIYTASEMPFGKYNSYDVLKKVAAFNDFDDNYRVMYNYSYTDFTNDTLLLNKNSTLRYFSSVINGDVINFFDRNLNAVGNNNYRLSAYDSPLLLSLMGNKYFYFTEEFNNSIYKKIDAYKIKSYDYTKLSNDTKDVYLYENPYALSLGYVIESDFSYEKDMSSIDYQNNIIKAFSGINEDVLIVLDYENIEDDEICNDSEGYEYCKIYEINNNTNNVLIYIYNVYDEYRVLSNNVKTYVDVNCPIVLSTIEKKIKFNERYNTIYTDEDFLAVTYDENNLINSLSSLQENMLENIKINKNIMTGEIDSSKNGILFLSIPYEKKFKIYVDGEKVDYYPVIDNAFIGLDIEEGKHDVRLEYVDENYKWYIMASSVSIIITLGLYYFINKKITKRQAEIALMEQLEKERMQEKALKNKNKKEKNKKKR